MSFKPRKLLAATLKPVLSNRHLSTVCIALLALPASVSFYGGWLNWLHQIRSGKPVFTEVLGNPIACFESIDRLAKPIRTSIFLPYVIARQMHQEGGLLNTLINFQGLYLSLGLAGFVNKLLSLQMDVLRETSEIPPPENCILFIAHSNQLLNGNAVEALVHEFAWFGMEVALLVYGKTLPSKQKEAIKNYGISTVLDMRSDDAPLYYIASHGHEFSLYYLYKISFDDELIQLIKWASPVAKIFSQITPGQIGNPIRHLERVIVGVDFSEHQLKPLSNELHLLRFDDQCLSDLLDIRHYQFEGSPVRCCVLGLLYALDLFSLAKYIDYIQTAKPVSFACHVQRESVDVSIIIPVFNQWSHTQNCLNSVFLTVGNCKVCFEIIIADDSSTDETAQAMQHYPDVRVIRTRQNVGFLRNCNNAVKLAKGKMVLLLNNDTIVLPNWLDALCLTMQNDTSVAIVGSKLLYPDGIIQEAGGILWNDGTAHNCGRDKEKTDLRYDYLREVDYVSGASMLIRKSFWDAANGFDERYQNAYCEDSDLAMTARMMGYRVMYESRSEVVHLENVSYSEARTDELHPAQRQNIQTLRTKWQEQFESHHLPPGSSEHQGILNAQRGISSLAQARYQQGQFNLLYFSPFPSHPNCHGNQATIQEFGRCFQAMGHKVHFALLKSGIFNEDDSIAMRQCWDSFDILPNTHPLSAIGDTIPFDDWYEEGLGERIRCLCAKYDIDIVFCSYVFQSKLLEYIPDTLLKVIDTHDKMGNRYDMLRAKGQPLEFFSCTPEEEGEYLRRADVVVARRQEEANYFNSVTGRSSAIVIPHVEPPRFVQTTFTKLTTVGLVASANTINLAIVRDFLKALQQYLQGRECPFTVQIAGQVKDLLKTLPAEESSVFHQPWVKMLGFVPDIAGFYAIVDLVISPVTMGTGINVKTVQAMAFGMPLLSTAWAVKGIETNEPLHSYQDLNALVEGLFGLYANPAELQHLAEVSRQRYTAFHHDSLEGMRQMFSHPKLLDR